MALQIQIIFWMIFFLKKNHTLNLSYLMVLFSYKIAKY